MKQVTGHTAWIGIGSNIEDREYYLKSAIERLQNQSEMSVRCISSIYETEPVGYVDQDAFLNMVAAVQTTLDPEQVLQRLLSIEQSLGRVRDVRWGPRTIDLDLLLFDTMQLRYQSASLILPHPRMDERGFVLVPLEEAMSIYGHPDVPRVRELISKLDKMEGIERWKTLNWLEE